MAWKDSVKQSCDDGLIAANAALIDADNHAALVEALENIVNTYRTFRNVPLEDQGWTGADDEALEAGFVALARARAGYRDHANARLIAAAPELLAALEHTALVFDTQPDAGVPIALIRAAIAKARE